MGRRGDERGDEKNRGKDDGSDPGFHKMFGDSNFLFSLFCIFVIVNGMSHVMTVLQLR